MLKSRLAQQVGSSVCISHTRELLSTYFVRTPRSEPTATLSHGQIIKSRVYNDSASSVLHSQTPFARGPSSRDSSLMGESHDIGPFPGTRLAASAWG